MLHTYVQLNQSKDWIDSIDQSDPAGVATTVAKAFESWAPELTALIADGETPPVLRPIHALPGEHK